MGLPDLYSHKWNHMKIFNKIKNSIFIIIMIIVVMIFIPVSLKAQLGIKAGISASSFRYAGTVEPNQGYDIDLRPYLGYDAEWVQLADQKPLISPVVSIYTDINLGKGFIVRPELGFVQKGVNLSGNEYQKVIYKVKINYLELPVNIAYNMILKENFKGEIFIGGYISALINANKKTALNVSDPKATNLKSVKSFDSGLTYGFGLKPKIMDHFFRFDLRVSHGLSDIFKVNNNEVRMYTTTQKTYNYSLFLSIGYEF